MGMGSGHGSLSGGRGGQPSASHFSSTSAASGGGSGSLGCGRGAGMSTRSGTGREAGTKRFSGYTADDFSGTFESGMGSRDFGMKFSGGRAGK